jgi:hypothetical protein
LILVKNSQGTNPLADPGQFLILLASWCLGGSLSGHAAHRGWREFQIVARAFYQDPTTLTRVVHRQAPPGSPDIRQTHPPTNITGKKESTNRRLTDSDVE